ncbi:cyclic pyranopterin monophosphate synthase MoaC [bacterium]|nr:cyclic pyranopterin monophosphate synthase MoaC [candidate division CSSED10-310 bacterium]
MERLSHIDEGGRARMVDVGEKPMQIRTATARGTILMQAETRTHVAEAANKKGDVLTVSEIAGIQAAKRTAELIPLCHPLISDVISVRARLTDDGVSVTASVRCHGRTGAEMEALTAVSVALLTVYDMCKAVDKRMVITGIELVSKEKHDE